MLRRTLLKTISTVIAAFPVFLSTAYSQEITLRAHHFLPPSSPAQQELIEPWAKQVEADSNGRIRVQISPSMQLGGKPPQLYDQVRDGVVDIAWTLLGYTPGRFPIAEVFELPFMVTTAEATTQAAQAFSEKHLKDELGHVHPLLVHVHAPGKFHLATKPVKQLEDLKGMKIRAPSRTVTDALNALGATPVGMPVPEVSQSLSMRVIDGAVIPWEVALPLRIHEVTQYHTEFGGEHGFYTAVFLFAMNKSKYESLPDDLKAVIDNNSGMNLAQRVGRAFDEAEEPGRQAAVERGNEITVIPAEDVERWKEATQPVIEAWVESMNDRGLEGEKLLEEARSLIEQYSQ